VLADEKKGAVRKVNKKTVDGNSADDRSPSPVVKRRGRPPKRPQPTGGAQTGGDHTGVGDVLGVEGKVKEKSEKEKFTNRSQRAIKAKYKRTADPNDPTRPPLTSDSDVMDLYHSEYPPSDGEGPQFDPSAAARKQLLKNSARLHVEPQSEHSDVEAGNPADQHTADYGYAQPPIMFMNEENVAPIVHNAVLPIVAPPIDRIVEKTVKFAAPPVATELSDTATNVDESAPSTSSSSTAMNDKQTGKKPTAYDMPPGMATESAKRLFNPQIRAVDFRLID
jgi:hypothetical protein